ncbi:response regulator [Paenibacillus sp. J5C_2022]|uniref:response regulator n=1 Tax=Paenibacillus sp. J5C2022 TaxID=2977129 RepID=UPI0021D2AEBC|nr:response regulator [Paenibacillus sp. J5C2022]MCU6711350.1 response regulator [Paenibacillus sp. J5C2022]
MIKVLVVDDEIRQRQSIIKHVPWQKLRMIVIGEAEDASQALERDETPDVLITDIRLMGSSGLDLAADMRSSNPQLKVVMVTGYEQFEYAKTALDIGVEAFLVKPIDFVKLEEILLQIAEQWEQEQRLLEKLQEYAHKERASFLEYLLHGLLIDELTLESQAAQYGLFADAGYYMVIVAVCVEDCTEAEEAMIACAQTVFDESLEAYVSTSRQQLAFIVRTGTEQGRPRGELERLAEMLQEAGVPGIAIGIGGEAASPSKLANSYRHAVCAVNQRMLGVEGPLYDWNQLNMDGNDEHNAIPIEEQSQQLIDLLASGEGEAARRVLGGLTRRLVDNAGQREGELRAFCLDLVTKAGRIARKAGVAGKEMGTEQELWQQLLACSDDQELIRTTVHLLAGCCQLIGDRKRSHAQGIVQRAIEYMNDNYMNNLSLRSVADAVYLSPNYLGALLRSELGISFTDQLVKIRIARAKELLLSPDLKLYEVADRIGYQNFGHFSNLFKRMTGFTPKDYRQFHSTLDRE